MPVNHVTVSVPSKLIVCGEHSICYGKCAIALALKKPRLELTVSVSDELSIPFDGLSKDAVLFIAERVKCTTKFELRIQSDIPEGVGLGSSAALCVALTVALLHFAGKQLVDDVILRISRAAECLFHGKSSGLDTTMCALGGIIQYNVDGSFNCTSKLPPLSFLIVNTNVKRNTSQMVNLVSANRIKYPNVVDNIINALEEISKLLWKCLCSNNFDFNIFKECTWSSHYLLDSLGVGAEELDKIVAIARHYNVAAKLTGAGGGGCAFIAFTDAFKELESLYKDLDENGFQYHLASISSSGYRLEN